MFCTCGWFAISITSLTNLSLYCQDFELQIQAQLCARFVSHVFSCSMTLPVSVDRPSEIRCLDKFICYTLCCTRPDSHVIYAALYLLWRIKMRFPGTKVTFGHRLIVTAFIIAHKVLYDETYTNRAWIIACQGLFTIREVNQMERDMCYYLDWQFVFGEETLKVFTEKVNLFFEDPGPYGPVDLSRFAPLSLINLRRTTEPVLDNGSWTSSVRSAGATALAAEMQPSCYPSASASIPFHIPSSPPSLCVAYDASIAPVGPPRTPRCLADAVLAAVSLKAETSLSPPCSCVACDVPSSAATMGSSTTLRYITNDIMAGASLMGVGSSSDLSSLPESVPYLVPFARASPCWW